MKNSRAASVSALTAPNLTGPPLNAISRGAEPSYDLCVTARELLRKGLLLLEHERPKFGTVDQQSAVSIEDTQELKRRAREARAGTPGIDWEEVKRSLKRSSR